MKLALLLARRFYRSARREGENRRHAGILATRIATIGVAVGVAIMIISVGIVKGFQREVKGTITGFAAHLEVLHPASFASPESFPTDCDSAFIAETIRIPGVKHLQRVSQKMGILKTEDAYQTILLKGIGEDYDTRFLGNRLVAGKMPEWGSDSASQQIVISRRQADALHLEVGTKIYTYFVNDDIRLRRFTITGIYETNLSQFDEHIVWAARATVNKLNRWGADSCSSLEIIAEDFEAIPSIQAQITRYIANRPTMNQRDTSPLCLAVYENPRTAATFQWLDLLDINVWVILGLMAGVAGFTMISGLLILILERTRTIGILKTLGASNTRIRHTFMAYAGLIALRGLLWGNALGIGVLLLQHFIPFVRLNPAVYYVTDVPVSLDVIPIILINVFTLFLIYLALVLPSFLISRISPARSVRYE